MGTIFREITTEATLQEKKKLRKDFRLFDMIFYTMAAILGIDTLGVISTNGGQGLTWLVISAITFLFPYGLLAAELGSTFTQEGGIYEWCKMAGGRFYGALAATLYWISNPLWVGGTLAVTAITAIKTFWFGNPNVVWGNNPAIDAICEMGVALLFIWGTTLCAILSLHVGKWLSVIGSYVKLILFGIFILLAIFYFFGGHAKGAHLGLVDLIPSSDLPFVFSAVLPALIFNWVGFELQNGASEEMHNPQRDVPRAIIRAGITTVIAYIVPIAIITFALPKDQLSNASGFLASFKLVATVLPAPIALALGVLVALGVVVALASSGGTWVIGADRTMAISALDRNGPAFLGRFSRRYGTPIVVNILSGIVSTLAMAGAISVNAFSSDPNITALFGLVLGFTISTTTLSYLFIFPAYLILKYKYAHVKRVYSVPGGKIGAWIVTILPLFYAALASYYILIPTDSTISNYKGITRTSYELTQFVPLIIIVLLTIGLFIWGHSEKQNQDVEVEINIDDGTTDNPPLDTITPALS
ncbi:APC family permease [Dictyobacter kobayashii]|uniref:Putative amino acid permease n=1 Tax=Dictyobacter kobayashii TaxID=2014872 RepID=A0A402AXQ6_9CHLR|nr:APC family permease [Dictyobacter kobayashii]GCE23911.1 putative amino acid permease [Dictyobacter kobayashii]